MTQLDRQEMPPVSHCSLQAEPLQIMPSAGMPEAQSLNLMQQVIDRLEQTEGLGDSFDEQLQQYLRYIMLDPAQVVAGNLRQHLADAWQMLVGTYGSTKQYSQVLIWRMA